MLTVMGSSRFGEAAGVSLLIHMRERIGPVNHEIVFASSYVTTGQNRETMASWPDR